MPFDPTIVIIFGTLFLSLVLSLIYAYSYQVLKHKASKRRAEDAGSIGVSELEALVHRATLEATRPLEERLAALEAEVRSLHDVLDPGIRGELPAREAKPLLTVPEEDLEQELAGNPSRRRVR